MVNDTTLRPTIRPWLVISLLTTKANDDGSGDYTPPDRVRRRILPGSLVHLINSVVT